MHISFSNGISWLVRDREVKIIRHLRVRWYKDPFRSDLVHWHAESRRHATTLRPVNWLLKVVPIAMNYPFTVAAML